MHMHLHAFACMFVHVCVCLPVHISVRMNRKAKDAARMCLGGLLVCTQQVLKSSFLVSFIQV